MEAVDHLELSAQVFLREVVKHASVHETLHEGASVLGKTETRQPLVADPLVVHVAKRQRLKVMYDIITSVGVCSNIIDVLETVQLYTRHDSIG